MLTKIVYVVVANRDSIYLEQAYASIWSLKYHNPNAIVYLIMDDKTALIYNGCGYDEFKNLVNEVVVKSFSDEIDNHTRSRWLKTNLRSLLRGNYLFLDTDTIICDDISEIDGFSGTIGAVVDGHRYIDNCPIYPFVLKWMNKYFKNVKILPSVNYYNSGVMFVKDTPEAYKFYFEWHKNWENANSKGFKFDQLPLFATDNTLGGIISPLRDIFNYQVSETVKYLYSSKILHFFNGESSDTHPFFCKSWLKTIKTQNCLTTNCKADILNCKGLFVLNTKIIGATNVDLLNSHAVKFIKNNMKRRFIYRPLDMTARIVNYACRLLGFH